MSIRAVGIFLLLFSVFLLSHSEAKSGSDYTIINTGLKAGGCWYDNTHFIVIKEQQPMSGQAPELEGLYFLDPNKPKELRRIDLSPIEPSLQKRIRTVSCQDQTILFYLRSGESGLQQLYGLKIGSQPELIAEMRGGSVNLGGRYIISQFRRAGAFEAEGVRGIGIYEAHPDCGVKYVKPGLKTLCLDTWMEPGWGLPNFRLIQYTWYETIKVEDKNGQEKWVPNPEPPLRHADGTELKQGYLLRDLENRIVQEISLKQGLYQMIDVTFKADSLGKHLYSVCFKAGDHGDRHFTVGGRICRFLLDGRNQDWEEVMSVQRSPNDPFSLHDLSVNAQGDMVMIERGHRPAISLWKYTAQSKKVEKLTHVVSPDDLRVPQVSPNGRWVSVLREAHLVLIESKGETP